MIKLTHGDFAIEMAGDYTATQRYLLQYGFTQSMQDAVAGTAKSVRELAAECRAGGDDFDKALVKWQKLVGEVGMEGADFEDTIGAVEAVAKAAVKADAQSRYDAILAGTVGSRTGGPRVPQVDRVAMDIAEEEIRVAHTTKKIKLPDAAGMRELVQRHVAKNGDRLRASAQRRIDDAKAAADSAAELLA